MAKNTKCFNYGNLYCEFYYFTIVFVFYVGSLYLLLQRFFSCAHPIFFGRKVHSIVFLFCFVLFCTSLINFCYIFAFFIFKFCLNMLLTTPNSFN